MGPPHQGTTGLPTSRSPGPPARACRLPAGFGGRPLGPRGAKPGPGVHRHGELPPGLLRALDGAGGGQPGPRWGSRRHHIDSHRHIDSQTTQVGRGARGRRPPGRGTGGPARWSASASGSAAPPSAGPAPHTPRASAARSTSGPPQPGANAVFWGRLAPFSGACPAILFP